MKPHPPRLRCECACCKLHRDIHVMLARHSAEHEQCRVAGDLMLHMSGVPDVRHGALRLPINPSLASRGELGLFASCMVMIPAQASCDLVVRPTDGTFAPAFADLLAVDAADAVMLAPMDVEAMTVRPEEVRFQLHNPASFGVLRAQALVWAMLLPTPSRGVRS